VIAYNVSQMDPLKALERVDPWGEWRNPQEHPEVLEVLVGLDAPYEASVGYIRALRPREDPHEATRWWASPEARAHLLNAILRRGGRPLVAVERELDLPRWKLHYYLDQFGFRLRMRPRRGVHVILPAGEGVDGEVVQHLSEVPVRAVVETDAGWFEAEWSRTSWAFRALRPVPPPTRGWRRLLLRYPLLQGAVDEGVAALYLGPEGYAALWRGEA